MALCLTGAGLSLHLGLTAFTLAWTHTVERTAWEEDWRVEADTLVLTQSRIKGSGAGMDPPPHATRIDGWFAWAPSDPRRSFIAIRRAPGIDDWQLCPVGMGCKLIGELLSPDADPVTLTSCP